METEPTPQKVGQFALDELTVNTLKTGFPTLDAFPLLQKRDMLVFLGARPRMGKTALMLQIAKQVATTQNVLFISLEMSKKALERRLLAQESGRSVKFISDGAVKASELFAAQQTIKGLNLWIEDTTPKSISQIQVEVKKFHKEKPLSLIMVDHIGEIEVPGQSIQKVQFDIACIGLRQLSKDLNVPILVASQLNGECVKRGMTNGDYRPTESDLYGSGRLGQMADLILMLSRQEVYDGSCEGEADIGVVKNKDGEQGWTKFKFRGSRMLFEDLKEF